jgi:hypothetical protein
MHIANNAMKGDVTTSAMNYGMGKLEVDPIARLINRGQRGAGGCDP